MSAFDIVAWFINDVEELAGARQGHRMQYAMTNELFKHIPPFRAQPNGLLVCDQPVGALDRHCCVPAVSTTCRASDRSIGPAHRATWTPACGGRGAATPSTSCRGAQGRQQASSGCTTVHDTVDSTDGVTTADYSHVIEQVGPSLTRGTLRRFLRLCEVRTAATVVERGGPLDMRRPVPEEGADEKVTITRDSSGRGASVATSSPAAARPGT